MSIETYKSTSYTPVDLGDGRLIGPLGLFDVEDGTPAADEAERLVSVDRAVLLTDADVAEADEAGLESAPVPGSVDEVAGDASRDELRDRARAAGLATSGTKADLAERLAEHEAAVAAEAAASPTGSVAGDTPPEEGHS